MRRSIFHALRLDGDNKVGGQNTSPAAIERSTLSSHSNGRGIGLRKCKDGTGGLGPDGSTSQMAGSGLSKRSGAGEGTRTPDPIITNDVLYQLSYTGTSLRALCPSS